MGNCRKGLQAEVCEKSALVVHGLEQTQGARDVSVDEYQLAVDEGRSRNRFVSMH